MFEHPKSVLAPAQAARASERAVDEAMFKMFEAARLLRDLHDLEQQADAISEEAALTRRAALRQMGIEVDE